MDELSHLAKPPVNVPGHENVDVEDIENCPFMQKKPGNDGSELPVFTNMSGGSCPAMDIPPARRPPKLEPLPFSYEVPYVSSLQFLLEQKTVFGDDGKALCRKKFDSYPMYYKETLFLDDDALKNARKLEMMQRMINIDTVRETANE